MPQKGILWSCISRDNTILVEAGEDDGHGSVIDLSQKLLNKKSTPGWEFCNSRRSGLKGIKFHLYDDIDYDETKGDNENNISSNNNLNKRRKKLVWIFACIYEKSLEIIQAKSFLEKLVFLTEPMRNDSYIWRQGITLAAQPSFAPTLFQRMEQVSWQGRLSMVNQIGGVNETKRLMKSNIDTILMTRDGTKGQLDTRIEDISKIFEENAKAVKRFQMWQKAKHGVVLGSFLTIVTAVVAVPTLVALLI
mmetsp:Transcript_6020/g.8872  ORF Transcript_6020/g.8872 Transcript_6020/m.8872 type:complete len:249 (+) Transcript_6020:99-845(+)